MSTPAPDRPERLGDYEAVEEVGRGPSGYVVRVRDGGGREFAAKVLYPRYADDPVRVLKFESEARLALSLHHPHIVRVHRLVTRAEAPTPFYLMDFLGGGHIGRHRRHLTAAVLGQVADVCDALHHIHAHGLVHFDVKPTNILLATDGTAFLADFGTTASAGVPPPGGTLPYMSPEHFDADRPDARADVYSAGVVLYELATGELPYMASNPFALQYQVRNSPGPPEPAKAVAPAVWAIVRRAMASRPADRYPTTRDMAEDLRSIQ